jgi:hypothetical protein
MPDDDITPGEIAYDAYCEARDWKSVRGELLPPFTGQTEELQQAWETAAKAVITHHEENP